MLINGANLTSLRSDPHQYIGAGIKLGRAPGSYRSFVE